MEEEEEEEPEPEPEPEPAVIEPPPQEPAEPLSEADAAAAALTFAKEVTAEPPPEE